MYEGTKKARNPDLTRQRLVAVARDLVLRQGFSATGVEQICRDAGVTKGAFFHHFKTKDQLGEAVLAHWADFGMGMFVEARSRPARRPLDHFHRFIDILVGVVRDPPGPVTCIIGIVAQEKALVNPALRASCDEHFETWTDFVRQLLDAAKAVQAPAIDFDPEEVAWFLNSIWQGSMLLAKAHQDPELIVRNLEQGRSHVERLFGSAGSAIRARRKRAGPR